MKAKEIVAKYKGKKLDTSLVAEIILLFMEEGEQLIEERGNSNKVILGVMRELDMKWKSVSKKLPELHPDGYRNFMKKNIPNACKELGWE